VVRPFALFLAGIGAPVERGFRQARLPYSALEDVNNYVPSHRFWEFLVNMAQSEGTMDLGFRVGERYGADSPDPHMTELLQRSPTLYSGLLKASVLSNRTISNCHVGILQPPDCGYAHFFHIPSCDRNNPAIEQIGWFGIVILLDMVRAYTGPRWQPAEIGVMTDQVPSDFIRGYFPHTRLQLSQPYSYIALDKAQLTLPPFPDGAVARTADTGRYDPVPGDFVDSLERVLVSYAQEDGLDIDLAARLCNKSKRTLQRKLREAGTSYSSVLGHARFKVASRLLRDPGMKITEIAKRLGYSDVSHFTRAFRRIAGLTPRDYRRQFTH
jgi:AraC-like DNA-binding protein